MAGKGFNLADVLKNVPKMDTSQKRIEYIDMDLLDDDRRNFYEMSGLDELAANIETVGLQQPLRVRPGEAGRYVIVSGHRRRAAVRMLVEDGREDLRRVPCIVEPALESEAMQELRLIFANSGTRKLTSPEIAAQAERVQELLYRLKEEGVEFPGRMRDHVAEACQVSKSKLARLRVIRKGLEEPLLSRWQSGKLDEASAYALARMPKEIQRRLGFAKLSNATFLEKLRERCEAGTDWLPELICTDGLPCNHSDGFLRHAVENPWDEACNGHKCCLDCQNVCNRICSKAKAVRKERQAEAEAKAAKVEERHIARAQRLTVPCAARVVRAADAAGLGDDVEISWVYDDQRLKLGEIRQWARGEFPGEWPAYRGSQLQPEDLRTPRQTAEALQCSADYLLGLTEEIRPGAAPTGYIMDHDPEGPVEAMVLLDYGMYKPYRTTARWDDQKEKWISSGLELKERVIGWYPIPETPEIKKKEELEDE